MLNQSSFFIANELEKRGYTVTSFYDKDLLCIEKDGRRIYTHASITIQQTSSYLICRDKYLSKEVLQRFHFPTAKGVLLTRDNIEKARELRFPLVLKPLKLSGGVGISLNIKSVDGIREYFQQNPSYDQVLAEETLQGTDTRILIVRGKFFAACQREPAHVYGDGLSTIQQLVEIENNKRQLLIEKQEASGIHSGDINLIVFDHDSVDLLASKSMTPATIPSGGQKVYVRSNANVSTGGISVDVTDDVCAEIRTMCEQVAAALKMTMVGIDIMSDVLSKSLSDQEGAGIVEINASPGLTLHILTDIGKRRDPIPLIVDEIEEEFSALN